MKRLSKKKTAADSSSFALAESFADEVRILTKNFIAIAFQNIANIVPQIISNIFIGHLSNADTLLAGVGLAKTFINVTGVSIAWGMNSALYTLVPQAIGAKKPHLLQIYIQRSIFINLCLFIPLTVIQFFAAKILISVGEPSDLYSIIQKYCIYSLPYIFLNSFNNALRRVAQASNLNMYLVYLSVLWSLLSWPINTLFVYYFDMGYIGTAVATNTIACIQLLCTILLLYYKNLAFVLIPARASEVLTRRGLKSFISLSVPGLFQYSLEWWIMEIAVVVCGYVHDPQLSVGATVVTSQINMIALMTAFALGTAVSYRIGKYVGACNVAHAQRSLRAGACMSAFVSLAMGAFFLACDGILPRLWTYDASIVALAKHLMHVLVVMQMTVNAYQLLGGVYRGLGMQKIAAVIMICSYYLLALPLGLVLLFGHGEAWILPLGWRADTTAGTVVIWGSLALGNGLAAACLVAHLRLWGDWEGACIKSTRRILGEKKHHNGSSGSSGSSGTSGGRSCSGTGTSFEESGRHIKLHSVETGPSDEMPLQGAECTSGRCGEGNGVNGVSGMSTGYGSVNQSDGSCGYDVGCLEACEKNEKIDKEKNEYTCGSSLESEELLKTTEL